MAADWLAANHFHFWITRRWHRQFIASFSLSAIHSSELLWFQVKAEIFRQLEWCFKARKI
jgi:hypothetical protein